MAALAALPLVPCYLILGPQCTIAILTIVTKKCLFGGKKGVCGFVMEYHPLGSLRSALPARQMTKTLQLQDQFKWALQIVSLLIRLNSSAKIFYPDLRPENLLNNDNNIVLVDFEQRGGWHPCGPPEVCYLKYLQTLCAPTGNSTSHPIAKCEALLLEQRKSRATVEEWDVWPQGPRLQGEDGGEAGARGSNKTTEQPNNRTSTRHRNIIDTHQNRT